MLGNPFFWLGLVMLAIFVLLLLRVWIFPRRERFTADITFGEPRWAGQERTKDNGQER